MFLAIYIKMIRAGLMEARKQNQRKKFKLSVYISLSVLSILILQTHLLQRF